MFWSRKRVIVDIVRYYLVISSKYIQDASKSRRIPESVEFYRRDILTILQSAWLTSL